MDEAKTYFFSLPRVEGKIKMIEISLCREKLQNGVLETGTLAVCKVHCEGHG